MEAVKHLQAKGLMPTALTSAQLRDLDAALRRQSVFSAQTTMEGYLKEIKAAIGSIVEPQQVLRPGETQTVTEGMNPVTARVALKEYLKKQGYVAPDGKAGTIEDLSSNQRINLVVRTNTQLAQGAGQFVKANESEDEVDLFPAQELYRAAARKKQRDWGERWLAAADESGDEDAARVYEETGRMVALKSSGIWQALGDGAGGYDDTLGNPYAPFAFESGMDLDNVSRADATELGLLDEGEKAEPAKFDFASLFKETA